MDLLSQHEAFLRAIYDAPGDDTPRLVYADFLQENGEEDRAQFIRWQCGCGEQPKALPGRLEAFARGFPRPWKTTAIGVDALRDPVALRRSLLKAPECFAVEGVRLVAGRITTSEPFDALFALAAFARVTELNLEGGEVEEEAVEGSPFTPFHLEPVISTAGVEALVQHRGVRKITALILTNNNLDNDAARALVKSPYLDNLKRLDLLEGNRFRGKVWQQVLARFGEDVVG
ncbi:MAG TPA: TIGR02996 domain-containing protein [Gemmata sp.]